MFLTEFESGIKNKATGLLRPQFRPGTGRSRARQAGADILCFGHTHKPFYKRVSAEPEEAPKGQETCFRHAINIGSVGKPKDGDPRACYAMLTIDERARPGSREGVNVEFIRVAHDVEQAAKAVEDSIYPTLTPICFAAPELSTPYSDETIACYGQPV